MKDDRQHDQSFRTGDELLGTLTALANPHRLRIIAVLLPGREYVSELARRIGMSRPLLHMHLKRLQAAGLVNSELELSKDGKAVRYFEVTPFAIWLTPEVVATAAATLSDETGNGESQGRERPESDG